MSSYSIYTMISFSILELIEGIASALAFGLIYSYIKMYTNLKYKGIELSISWFVAWLTSKIIIKLVEKTDIAKKEKNITNFMHGKGYEYLKEIYNINNLIVPNENIDN